MTEVDMLEDLAGLRIPHAKVRKGRKEKNRQVRPVKPSLCALCAPLRDAIRRTLMQPEIDTLRGAQLT
jgi:hypothetical protein